MSKPEIAELFNTYVMPTYAPSLTLVKGKGVSVWDSAGRQYLDFLSGISVLNVGHAHPRVVEAIQKQVEVLTHVSNLYYTENEALLAKRLSELSMGGKCFFGNSGAEANEGLIKLARLWGHDEGRYELISMENSFHGRTLATAAATGQTKVQQGFEPMPTGFALARFNDLDSVAAAVTEKTVAVLIEAIQGEGGIIPAEPDFMTGLRAFCDDKNLLMLCDEVQCGVGRTGTWFGFQQYGVEPDAFSLAKALGSGYPIGAVVSSKKMADTFQPGKHASTFGGTPLACAAALATLDVIEEEGLLERAATAGKRFADGLAGFASHYDIVEGARGKGLMLGLVLNQPAAALASAIIEKGMLCIATGETVVRFLPPLTVSDEDIDKALSIVEDALKSLA